MQITGKFLGGMMAGALLMYLLDPQGQDRRRRLQDKARDLAGKVRNRTREVADDVREGIEEGRKTALRKENETRAAVGAAHPTR
jgi:hypothetical protein